MRYSRLHLVPCALFVAGLICGCSHVQVVDATHLNGQALSREGGTVAHLNASSWGIYLFNWIPLVSGSLDTPGRFTLLQDTAKVEDAVELLTRKASELGADRTDNLQSFTDSWWQTWSLVIWMRAAYASGNAIVTDSPVSSSR